MDHEIDDARVEAAFDEMEFVRALKHGGMKNAYVVRLDDRECVLKLIRRPVSVDVNDIAVDEGATPDEAMARILREIDGMNRVRSPNVVALAGGPDVRDVDGHRRVWYLEPLIPGGSLAEHFGDRWDEQRVISLGRDLFAAVNDLNLVGIVHRDIKPDNVVLDSDGRAILIDLGIALILDLDRLTDSGALSPQTRVYAAPEQLVPRREARLDFRTDLFAVGLVLYEAITGRHPFNPAEPVHYFDRLFDGDWDVESCREAGASRAMLRLLGRLLAPAQSGRYRSMAFALEALEECDR